MSFGKDKVYFRGLSLALFETGRRYAGDVPNAAEIVAAALRRDRSNVATHAPLVARAAGATTPV